MSEYLMKRILSKHKSYELKMVGDHVEITKIEPLRESVCDFDLDAVKELLRAGQGDCDHCDPVQPNIFLTDRVSRLDRSNEQRKKDIKHSWNRCDRVDTRMSVIEKNHADLYAKFGVIQKEVNTAPLYDFSKRIAALEGIIEDALSTHATRGLLLTAMINQIRSVEDANAMMLKRIHKLEVQAEVVGKKLETHEAGTLCHTECPIKIVEEKRKVGRPRKPILQSERISLRKGK